MFTKIRRFWQSEKGISNVIVAIGAVTVFAVVSVGIGTTLQTATATMQQQKVNSAVAGAVSDMQQRTVTAGYQAAAESRQRTYIPVTIAGHTMDALQTIELDEDAKTATVTVRAGKYAGGEWKNPDTCDKTPSNCMTSVGTATATLAQSIPTPAGITAVDASVNESATGEVRWMSIAASDTMITAVDQDGRLWRWGGSVTTPQRVTVDGATFTQVVAGKDATYALDTRSGLWVWGQNDYGQLGLGDKNARTAPTKLSGEWSKVAAGSVSACAINTSSELFCWGNYANLIAGTSAATAANPVRVKVPDDASTSTDESAFGITDIALGTNFAVAADERGSLYTWGANSASQLGNGKTGGNVTKPARLTLESDGDGISGTRIASVGAGKSNGYAIDVFGRMWGWGANDTGLAGVGTEEQFQTEPVRIGGEAEYRQVSATNGAAFAITRDGELHAWGTGATSIIDPDSARVPSKVSFQKSDVFTGETPKFLTLSTAPMNPRYMVAVDSTHRVWMWGAGNNLPAVKGDGTSDAVSSSPHQMQMRQKSAGTDVVKVAGGYNLAATLTADGSLSVWGVSTAAAPAREVTTGSVPVSTFSSDTTTGGVRVIMSDGTPMLLRADGTSQKVTFPAGQRAVKIVETAPSGAVLIVTSRGGLYAPNSGGELTIGSGVTVTDVALTGSGDSTVAHVVDSEGRMWRWAVGDLSKTVTDRAAFPKNPVGFAAGVLIVSVAAEGDHVVVTDTKGRAWSWGSDGSELGNGQNTTGTPTRVKTVTQVMQVATSRVHSLALTADGSVYGWGVGGDGKAGAQMIATAPTKITFPAGASKIVKVDAGTSPEGTVSVAIGAAGDVWYWGAANYGATTAVKATSALSPTRFANDGRDVSVSGTGFVTVIGHDAAAHRGVYESGKGTKRVPDGATFASTNQEFRNDEVSDIDMSKYAGVSVSAGNLWRILPGSNPTRIATPFEVAKASVSYGPGLTAQTLVGQRIVLQDTNGRVWMGTFALSNATGGYLAGLTRLPITGEVLSLEAGYEESGLGAVLTTTSRVELGEGSSSFPFVTETTATPAGTRLVGGGIVYDPAQKAFVTTGAVVKAGEAAAAAGSLRSYAAFPEASGTELASASVLPNGSISAVTASGATRTFAPEAGSKYVSVALARGAIIVVDDTGTAWSWGTRLTGRSDGVNNLSPGVIDTGTAEKSAWTLHGVNDAATARTLWIAADVTGSLSGDVQVNVDAALPVTQVAYRCSNGGLRGATKTEPSSGSYSYANVKSPSLSGCTTPKLVVGLDGWIANTDEVSVVAVPLVDAKSTPDGW